MGCAASKSSEPTRILVQGSATSRVAPIQEEVVSISRVGPIQEEAAIAQSTGASASGSARGTELEPPEVKVTEEEDSEQENKLEASMNSRVSQWSTSSGQSAQSRDSGVYELEDEYSHVITEHSDPEKVRSVENQFRAIDHLELVVEGKACPRKLSPKDKERLDKELILQMLREEGLIVRPEAKAVGGVKFELVAADAVNPFNISAPMLRRLPPLRLREKQKKKKKKELTYEEIQEKLAKAEERRKQQEEEKLTKLAVKDRLEVVSTAVEQQAEENRQKIEEKMEAMARSREQHLREVQDRLKAREEHANKVRMRKQLLLEGYTYTPTSRNE